MRLHLVVLCVLAILGTACGETGDAPEPAAETEQAPEATPEPPAEEVAAEEVAAEEVAPAAEPAPEAEAPPADGEAVAILALREGFAADAAAWTGRSVTVQAQFMSATNMNGSLNNISLIVDQEDYAEDRLRHSMMCAFGDDAPDSVSLRQYEAVTVRGTVVERFGRAGLEDCQIVE